MSIDLGSEWMKIAIVKPGVPMEIVLNKYIYFLTFLAYIYVFILTYFVCFNSLFDQMMVGLFLSNHAPMPPLL